MRPDENNLVYENVQFERRWLQFERLTWLLFSLLLVGSCLGVFGRGAYARQIERSGPLQVAYDRIARSRTQTDIKVTLGSGATSSGNVRLHVSGALLDKTRIFDVLPKPAGEEAFEGGAVLTFKVVPGKPADIIILQKVEGIGRVQSQVSLEGGPAATLNQIILP